MPAAQIRAFTSLIIVSLIVSGCASAPGAGPLEETINASLISVISGLAILILVIVSRWIGSRQWSPASRGGAIGFTFGLVLAVITLRLVPLNTQLVVIGAFLGVGTDFLSTIKEPGGPKTAVTSLSKLIVSTSRAVIGAAKSSGIEEPEYVVITSGLWSLIGTVAFTLVIGNLLPH
jgi:hypothetical protein